MTTIIALIIWSTGIAAAVELAKRIAKAAGRREHPAFVRSLPILPLALGALTGPLVVPMAAEQVGLEAFVIDPAWSLLFGQAAASYAMVGLAAGAVSGMAFKVIKQTLQGADLRIQSD